MSCLADDAQFGKRRADTIFIRYIGQPQSVPKMSCPMVTPRSEKEGADTIFLRHIGQQQSFSEDVLSN